MITKKFTNKKWCDHQWRCCKVWWVNGLTQLPLRFLWVSKFAPDADAGSGKMGGVAENSTVDAVFGLCKCSGGGQADDWFGYPFLLSPVSLRLCCLPVVSEGEISFAASVYKTLVNLTRIMITMPRIVLTVDIFVIKKDTWIIDDSFLTSLRCPTLDIHQVSASHPSRSGPSTISTVSSPPEVRCSEPENVISLLRTSVEKAQPTWGLEGVVNSSFFVFLFLLDKT